MENLEEAVGGYAYGNNDHVSYPITTAVTLSTSACCVRVFLIPRRYSLVYVSLPEPRLPFYSVSTYLPIP